MIVEKNISVVIMMDIFTKDKRHEVMSKIRSKDTKIEIQVRHWLYNHGVRYRKNCKDIFGKPDIAIKKYKIAIFVNGCFWHGHEKCKFYRQPKSNVEFWQDKIRKNKERDKINLEKLENENWNVFVVWECQTKSNFESRMQTLLSEIEIIKRNIDVD